MIDNAKILPKGLDLEIAYRLNAKEFRCKCTYSDCSFTIVNPRLLMAWTQLRAKFGKKLKVNSGFRCQRHNSIQPKSSPTSKHMQGRAIDISCDEFNPIERGFLLELCKEVFDTVIEYPTFYHCHIE